MEDCKIGIVYMESPTDDYGLIGTAMDDESIKEMESLERPAGGMLIRWIFADLAEAQRFCDRESFTGLDQVNEHRMLAHLRKWITHLRAHPLAIKTPSDD